MIINGGSRCNGAFFAGHLSNPEKNERVKLADIRGLAAKDIGQALYEMKAVASGTRCKNFFYHANLNPRDDERLTAAQWEKAVDALEKELGFEGQARFVVEHEKHGRIHRHVVWSRINVDKMKAIRMDNDFAKHQAVSRQLEKEFGLAKGVSVLGPEAEKGKRPERRPKQWEVFRGQIKGVNVQDLKEEITGLWHGADNAEAFISALEGRGYILAQGDSRAYCIVDRNGDVHSLARRIEGVKAADVREKMSGIDQKTLPHVKVAAAYLREQHAQETRQGGEGQDQTQAEEQKKAAIEQEETQRQEAVKEAEDRQQQAIQDAEQWRQAGLDEEKRREEFKEQADRQAEQAKEMEGQQERLDAYKAAMARQAETARREAEQRQGRHREGEIRSAHSRYGQALGQHYSVRDPYESLARSAMAEYGGFLRDRENLDRQIARTSDPNERQKLELRKEIEAAEYMALTSERIAGQSEIIVGKMNSPEAMRQRERAKVFQEQAQALRKEYRELGSEREQGKEQAGDKGREGEPPRAPATEKQQAEETRSSFKVEERTAGKPRGAEQNLTDFVKTIPEKPPRREFTKEELRNDPAAKRAHFTQLKDEQNRSIALDNIGMNMKTGKNLNTNDIRRLSREDLERIKTHGDKHLKEIVRQREQEKERGRGLER